MMTKNIDFSESSLIRALPKPFTQNLSWEKMRCGKKILLFIFQKEGECAMRSKGTHIDILPLLCLNVTIF